MTFKVDEGAVACLWGTSGNDTVLQTEETQRLRVTWRHVGVVPLVDEVITA